VVLSSVSLIVIGALLFFVLPRFAEVFADADMPLPMITRALLAFAGELRRYLILWIALAVGLVVGVVSFRSSQRGRAWIDGLQLHNPLINKITRALLTGRSFRLLGMMLESGVPLLEALRLTRTSVQNLVYRELFVRLEEAVLGGQDMSPTVAEHTFVPSAAAHMLATGERTGNLASVSQIMGEFYEEEGESRLKAMMTVMEPLIIVVLGVIVACIVLAVMIPMFDFATFAQHQK
jgi:type II secretory pathway component PulF